MSAEEPDPILQVGTRVRIKDGYFPEGSVFHQPPMTGTVTEVEKTAVCVDWDEHPHGGTKVGVPGKPLGMAWLACGYVEIAGPLPRRGE